jgi:hypothetical protein
MNSTPQEEKQFLEMQSETERSTRMEFQITIKNEDKHIP